MLLIIILTIIPPVLILLITSRRYTKPFLDPKGKPISNSIAKMQYLNLGGIKQWVLFRGYNKENPILIFLHGGPGVSEHALFRYYNSELEKHFVVVGWDQRETGKTYTGKLSDDQLKIEHFLSDLHELIKFVKHKFNKNKVYLMGKSWGSILGILYSQKYPENVEAYLAIGQVTDQSKSEELGYQFIYDKAKAQNNKLALKELKEVKFPIGSNYKDIITLRKWLIKFGGHVYGRTEYIFHWLSKFLIVNEYSWLDLITLALGANCSLKALSQEIFKINLFEQVPSLDIPVYFFIGKHDYCTSAYLAEKYFNRLKAQTKKIIWFEKSGHSPIFEEAENFNFALLKEINK